MTSLRRRTRYHANLLRSDFFVVRGLTEFIDTAIRANLSPGDLVVDIGCGEQPWRFPVEALGARYVGIDVGNNAAGTVAALNTADAISLRDASANLVLCTEVLEHVPEPDRAIREVRRILRPGGAAVVTTPFLYPLHEEPWDFQRLTLHQVRRFAMLAGFTVEELRTTGNELEVFATHWDRLWSNWIPPRVGVWRSVALALLRAPANILIAATSFLVGRALPNRAYLCTAALLRVPPAAE